MSEPRLSPRALNRATLERQLLLGERRDADPLETVELLLGMQAQNPLDPYYGLWTRLRDFDPGVVGAAVESGRAVRLNCMRSTIHLVTARDCAVLLPFTEPVKERGWRGSQFSKRIGDADPAEVLAEGMKLLKREPVGASALGRRLAGRWPDADPMSLAYTVAYLGRVAQLPPRGVWGRAKAATLTPVEGLIGRKLKAKVDAEEIIRRYLRAFGPASVRDVQAWCGVTRLRQVADGMEGLRRFRSEAGAELLDLTDMPLPDPETPAPPRFLPEYDNVVLGYDDRTRITTRHGRVPVQPSIGYRGLLVDGFFSGFWKIEKQDGKATLLIEPAGRLPKGSRPDLTAEGVRLLEFAAPDAEAHQVRFLKGV